MIPALVIPALVIPPLVIPALVIPPLMIPALVILTSPLQGTDNGNKDSCSNRNTSVTEEDVMTFITSLNNEEH